MESAKEIDVFSELSTVTIENFNDTIIVQLNPLMDVACSFSPPNNDVSNIVGILPKTEVLSIIRLLPEKSSPKPCQHRVTIKEQPLEIVIEQPLDDKSLVNLLELLGKHTPSSMSREQKNTLLGFLKEDHLIFNQLNFKKTGIRIVFHIPKQTFIPLYRLPRLFEHFIGREKELIQLQTQPKYDKNILQIAGTGGIGKSQLANYYARSQFKAKKYNWVIWMSGTNPQNESENLSSQFLELGLSLGLAVNQLKDEPLHLLIYERLTSKGGGLMVIDDAPNYKLVKPFLPENFDAQKIDVVITTRNSCTFGPSIKKIMLTVFTEEDAKLCIRHFLKEIVSENDIEVLAKTLDLYPLLLTQALTSMYEKQSIIEDDSRKLAHQPRQSKFDPIMKKVVESSLEQVKIMCKSTEAFELTMRVLSAASYLAPEVAIPKALLGKWLPEDEGEIYINEAIEALRGLSLLQEASQPGTYSVHKAVQDILKHFDTAETSHKKLLKWNEIIRSYLDSPSTKNSECTDDRQLALLPHLTILAENFIAEHYIANLQHEQSRADSYTF